MPFYMRESVHMIQQKIARILSGDPFEPDHWMDIEGYARLVSIELGAKNDGTSQQSTN
ncbi:hypothetical protein UFOVP1552_8 [uncultured Caudovirales phage]|uniref:Uncharacterized protein n=1 Tax=uncultured Caudovirales phage TaxID=2100421 RepID=A0A6J5PLP1_9CAUD|nr:hypothetical protein UFOVP933_42 [uncultured Caudovirales phage]CAB4177642.1 hypothetical protein UFOVP1014_27 [uncultured Caudovirales phage]CAB4202285.1 hypothetical protein UFOVP1368_1 [uncultured Caudovirales phage]CAB5229177.1 hypothetical protein UFOVP1552_8 [uncultured Caudovirales phage]